MAKIQAKAICSQDRFSSSRLYSAAACSVRVMWSRICGSTGRPIISISGGVDSSCTTARTRAPSPAFSSTTSPERACAVAQAGGCSTPRPANRPADAIIWPLAGS